MISKNLFNIFFMFATLLVLINCNPPEKYKLCGDKLCTKVISTAKTTINYSPSKPGILQFNPNKQVRIFSKLIDSDLWEIEIGGRRGLAPKKFIQEQNILIKKQDLIKVPIEVNKEEITKENPELTTPSQNENNEIKSSQALNVEDDIPTTTTAPLIVEEINKKIVTDKNDINSSNEIPNSSPVQKNIELIDGTSIEIETNNSSEDNNKGNNENDDDIVVSNENEEEDDDDEDEDDDDEDSFEDNININNKDTNKANTIQPSKTELFLNIASKTQSDIDNGTNINENYDVDQEIISNDNKSFENKLTELKENGKIISNSDELISINNTLNEDDNIPVIEIIPPPITAYLLGSKNNQELNNVNSLKDSINNEQKNLTEGPTITDKNVDEKLETDKNVEVPLEKEAIISSNIKMNSLNHDIPIEATETSNYFDINANDKMQKNEASEKLEVSESKQIVESTERDIISSNKKIDSLNHDITMEIVETSKDFNIIENNKMKKDETSEKLDVTGKEEILQKQISPEEETEHQQNINENNITDKQLQHSEQNTQEGHYHDHDHDHTHEPLFQYPQPLTNLPESIIKETSQIPFETTTPNYDYPENFDPYFESTTSNPINTDDNENQPSTETNISDELQSITNNEPLVTVLESENSVEKDIQPESEIPNENIEENLIIGEGIFSKLLSTVNSLFSSQTRDDKILDNELENILFGNKDDENPVKKLENSPVEIGFCENIGPNSCPNTDRSSTNSACSSELNFFTSMSDKILEMFDVLVCLAIAAASSILFAFGYYCICNCRKEKSLISKLNVVERSLLTSNKEVAIVKHDLSETRNKLASIEDSSFGSNDMVIALKNDIAEYEITKAEMQTQIETLEKELESAAEVGLELNKIVSDLLNSQNGDESIAKSVEELQKQLNEQQTTILEINSILGEKSRENSELNMFLAEQSVNYEKDLQEVKNLLEESEQSKIILQEKIDESQKEIEENSVKNLKDKTIAVDSLKNELQLLQSNYNDISNKLRISESRVQALEECINSLKKDSKINMKEFMNVANLKTDILVIKNERDSIKERLEGESDARKLLEDHVKIVSEEVSSLKLEYNQSEKDKLEAQTRLEVLSTYFKEKETQLQKELSVKEAMWMKQQGETTSTVERVRLMQDEIQGLKSQNDSLRAEIEAQSAAHKAQISSLEIRAHETWLTSRQCERKFEEARAEAAALRRKITALVGSNLAGGIPNDINRNQNIVTDGLTPNNLKNIPSPIHMDSPNSSQILGALPPPFMAPPPPFMAPPPLPHFMSIPPPFMPPGEMRPPPLGRLMSPPPMPPINHNRYSPSLLDEDYDDYEYSRHNRSGRYSPDNDHRYSPDHDRRYSPKNGRRYSPDSRYNYGTDIMSTYDTETDFSPPPSPKGSDSIGNRDNSRYDDRTLPIDNRGEKSIRGSNKGDNYKYSPNPQISNSDNRNKLKTNRGILSSGSEKSVDSRKSKGKMKV